jgi:hypothetical protein
MLDSFEFKICLTFGIAIGISFLMDLYQKRKQKQRDKQFARIMSSLAERSKND